MRRRVLVDVDVEAEGPILIQVGDGLVFQGVRDTDLVCSTCFQVLAAGVAPEQLLDLRIACGRCHAVLRTPMYDYHLGGQVKTLPPGKFLALLPQMIEDDTVFTSERAQAKQAARLRKLSGVDSEEHFAYDDPASLEHLVARLKGLLGESFDEIVEREKRAQARGGHGPRHRLGNAILRTLETAQNLRRDNTSPVYIVHLAQVGLVVSILERWKGEEVGAMILKSIRNPDDYPHTLMTLIFASHLAAGRNDIRLLPPDSQSRSSDLRLKVSAHHVVALEVKTPRRLRGPVRLNDDAAENILEDAVKKAGTNPGGQLDPTRPGVLLVGGFHLDDNALDHLERAAKRLLAKYGHRRTHIAGVGLLSFGVTGRFHDAPAEGTTLADLLRQEGIAHDVIGTLGVRWAANEHHVGDGRIFVSGADQRPLPDKDPRRFFQI